MSEWGPVCLEKEIMLPYPVAENRRRIETNGCNGQVFTVYEN